MPRSLSIAVENNFSKGLITEATALNFPENACTETFDCVFDKKGNVTRRLGIEPESSFEAFETDFADKAVTEYLWEAVAKNGEITIFVLQIGATLSFYGVNSESSLAPKVKPFEISLFDFASHTAATVDIVTNHASFDTGYGILFISHPFCDPIQVEYDSDTDDVESIRLRLSIRDMEGVANVASNGNILPIDVRPSDADMTQAIAYNLINQGWGKRAVATFNGLHWTNTLPVPLLVHWRGLENPGPNPFFPGFVIGKTREDWPSEGEVWWMHKGPVIPFTTEEGQPIPPVPPAELFSQTAFDKFPIPNTPAGKGYLILSAFQMDKLATATGQNHSAHILDLYSLPADTALKTAVLNKDPGPCRPSQIAFHAGRVWYGGVNHEDFAGEIFFSQILEGRLNADRCYQKQDPTSEESADLLSSDGGIVRIPEMARLVKMISIGPNLILWATNGIWRIGGGLGDNAGGFAANDYTVNKLSTTGAVSALSFVETDNAVCWWNHDGIWALGAGEGGIKVTSLSEGTIKNFIEELPSTEIRYVKGAYNSVSKIVQWLYRDTISESVEERYQYSNILNLDMNTGAFYPWTIPDVCARVVGITVIKGVGEEELLENVVNNDEEQVVDQTGEDVTVTRIDRSDLSSRFKYVVNNTCEIFEVPDGEESEIFEANTELIGVHDGTGFTNTYTPGQNGILVGEDNKIYTFANTAAGFPVQQIQQHAAGVGTTIAYSRATVQADAATATGKTWAVTSPLMSIFPVPYTQYFYFITAAREGASTYWGIISLYKIDATGSIVWQSTRLYSGGFSVVPFTAFYPAYATGYIGASDAPLLDKTLVVAVASRTSVVSGSSHTAVLQLPSVNIFKATNGTLGTWTDLLTAVNESWTLFAWEASEQADEGTNNCFLLPVSSTETKLCIYVSKAKADWLNDPTNVGSAFYNATLASFASSNTNGFVIGKNVLTGGAWSVMNSSFNVPFNDIGLNLNGSSGDPYYNDWQNPSVQTNPADGITYITWTRRYEPSEANFSPTGSWTLAKTFTWSQNSESTSLLTSVEGSGYDTVDDLGVAEGARYESYPVTAYSFMSPDFTELYSLATHDNTHGGQGLKFIIFKLADVNLPEITSIPSSLFFAEYTNDNYLDWEDITDGEDYNSYFITGYKLRGEGIRKWQSNYIQLYCNTTDVSSTFDVFAKWDYSNSGDTGRWSSVQRVALTNSAYDYGTKRLKIRGHGKAMQYKVSSITGEPFDIVGWASWDSTNERP